MKKSQCNQILKYIQTHKRGITQLQAIEKFGCFRLSGRIHDLRAKGYPIITETISKDGKKFACYKWGEADV